MAKIRDWHVIRSGAAMRVKGIDEAGLPITIKTSMIHAAGNDRLHPTAQDERGQYHDLI